MDMHPSDVIEISSKLLQEDMLCAHLNGGSRSLNKNHLSIFLPRMTYIFCSDHLHIGKKDLSCWLRAPLYYMRDADSSKSQIVLVPNESKNFQTRLSHLLCFQQQPNFIWSYTSLDSNFR